MPWASEACQARPCAARSALRSCKSMPVPCPGFLACPAPRGGRWRIARPFAVPFERSARRTGAALKAAVPAALLLTPGRPVMTGDFLRRSAPFVGLTNADERVAYQQASALGTTHQLANARADARVAVAGAGRSAIAGKQRQPCTTNLPRSRSARLRKLHSVVNRFNFAGRVRDDVPGKPLGFQIGFGRASRWPVNGVTWWRPTCTSRRGGQRWTATSFSLPLFQVCQNLPRSRFIMRSLSPRYERYRCHRRYLAE